MAVAALAYPDSGRAAVLEEFGERVQVQELKVPPLEPDAVLVKVEAATMCGSDVHIADGDLKDLNIVHLPLIMGHEIIGRIIAIGEGGKSDSLNRPLKLGDRIAWAYSWCDHCYWCTIAKQPTLCENSRMYGWGPANEPPYLTGGFADYCYVMPKCKIVKVPDGVDSRVAASATCAFRTIIHGYEEIGRLHTSDTVVIQGTGPVGLYALAFALQSGVREVICIGAPDDRLAIAKEWGASHALNVMETSERERLDFIRSRTDGRGADVLVECSGVAAAFEEGMGLMRRGGRYLVIGQAEPRKSHIQASAINARQLTILGTVSADVSHYYRALQFLADNAARFRFEAVLGRTYGLGEVNDALDAMRAGREPKPVIIP